VTVEVARRVASRFDSRWLRSYARSKLRGDPVYRAILERLRGSDAPVFDIGCGVGLLEFYLRENGFDNAITGIDHDERKIRKANSIAAQYPDLQFRVGDARDPIPHGATVVLIDVLHYFSDDDRRVILEHAARSQCVVIRDAVRDESLRYRVTVAQERFSRAVHWLRAERINFPKRDEIVSSFRDFSQEIVPMWGRTPFNNYLFVFRRSSSGTTKR
jgi:SAM-dependent methyltransferase